MNKIAKDQLKTSIEALCLDERCLEKLIGEPLYIGTLQTLSGQSERKFTPVYRGDDKLWADIITSTLYNKSGECMSSQQLQLIAPLENAGRNVAKKDFKEFHKRRFGKDGHK